MTALNGISRGITLEYQGAMQVKQTGGATSVGTEKLNMKEIVKISWEASASRDKLRS